MVRCVKPCDSRLRYAAQLSLMTSAWFNPVTFNGHQGVRGSVRYGNKKCSAGILFNTTKHKLTLNRMSPMVLSPTELAFVNFGDLVRTAERPAMKTSMVSLKNMPQSVTVFEPRSYSSLVSWAGSRHTMSYVTSKTSRKVRLLCRNQEPVLMDLDSENLTPATFLRHRHLILSGILGSADHVISRPQVLH